MIQLTGNSLTLRQILVKISNERLKKVVLILGHRRTSMNSLLCMDDFISIAHPRRRTKRETDYDGNFLTVHLLDRFRIPLFEQTVVIVKKELVIGNDRMFIRKSTKKQNSSFSSHGYQILVHRRDQHEQRVRAVNTSLSNYAPAPILNIKQSTFCCSSPVSSLEFLSRLLGFCCPATPLSAVHLYVYSTIFANYHDT